MSTSSPGWRTPLTALEQILCGLFAKAFTVEQVTIDVRRRDMGGDSLTAELEPTGERTSS